MNKLTNIVGGGQHDTYMEKDDNDHLLNHSQDSGLWELILRGLFLVQSDRGKDHAI